MWDTSHEEIEQGHNKKCQGIDFGEGELSSYFCIGCRYDGCTNGREDKSQALNSGSVDPQLANEVGIVNGNDVEHGHPEKGGKINEPGGFGEMEGEPLFFWFIMLRPFRFRQVFPTKKKDRDRDQVVQKGMPPTDISK